MHLEENVSDISSSPSDESNEDDINSQKFLKKLQQNKEKKRFDNLNHDEIYRITQWTKNSLWRRAKFINVEQQCEQVKKLFGEMKFSKEQREAKYFDTVILMNKNMNARRSYATKKVKHYLIGMYKDVFVMIYELHRPLITFV